MYDMIIRNGYLFDGTGNPWTKSDIGILNGKIKKITKVINDGGSEEIDARGLVVAPGFIDTHSHSDLLCLKPDIHKIKLIQGVTTELFGQDGISVAPVSNETKPLWHEQMKGINGDVGDWPWNSVDEYLSFLDQSGVANNVTYLIPHGNVRTMVVGFDGRIATKEEIQQMRALVEEGMRQGALGFSSGLQYPPCVYANKEELIEMCQVVAQYDGCYVVHIRNESNLSLEALDEVIDVARHTGVRLHVSHFKVCGKVNRDKFSIALSKLESGREEGIEITFDQYPYTASSTVLSAILPPWMHSGGTEQMLERLKDSATREKAKHDIKHNDQYDNTVKNNGWENIIISSVSSKKNKTLEGKSIQNIAESRGADPAETAFDILVEEHAAVTMIIHWGEEADVINVMKHPLQMVGSDGIFGGKPHPRLYGTFPRVLGYFSRDKNTFSLSEAIRKMTAAPAQLLRLKGRGLLKEGYCADIVVFNPDTVIDRATYDNPLQEPSGIEYVFVNGCCTVRNGKFTGETAGKVIRNQSVKTVLQ